MRGSVATSSMLKKKKCKFSKQEVEYLGHIVKDGHMLVDPTKIEAI